MLEHILSWWSAKILVLVLLGFAATDFMITMTLSAADASTHLLENPYTPHVLHHQFVVTLVLLAALAAVFLRGFTEAIGIAVVLVGIYLLLNTVVVADALVHLATSGAHVTGWWSALTTQHTSALAVIGVALVAFPKLALGLSGFETGVLVMPQVDGGDGDPEQRLARRIRGTRKLLTSAASVMAVLLLTSSFATAVLIPARQFQPGGAANGRAMAYLAHQYLGNGFGTAYDLSTVAILWFAGASAMAGLLNLVPRYLPRFLRAATPAGTINIIANEPDARDEAEYRDKLAEERAANRIPEQEPVMFLEVTVADASEFESELEVRGEDRFGHQVLTVHSTAVANAIAAITLDLRDRFAVVPHVYFDWTEGHPIANFLRFILWGSGEVAPVTREVLRRAEPDRARRPHIHVG
jgi:hypothetical protein